MVRKEPGQSSGEFEVIYLREWFHKRLDKVYGEQREIICAIRQNHSASSLLMQCDKLRTLEVEKLVILRLYEELKYLL